VLLTYLLTYLLTPIFQANLSQPVVTSIMSIITGQVETLQFIPCPLTLTAITRGI